MKGLHLASHLLERGRHNNDNLMRCCVTSKAQKGRQREQPLSGWSMEKEADTPASIQTIVTTSTNKYLMELTRPRSNQMVLNTLKIR